jgi:RecB family exonuclease
MKHPIPISPSNIADFEGCPKRYRETKLLKRFKFEVTDAITHGNVVHEQLEKYVKYKQPLPEHLEKFGPFIDGLRESGYDLFAELEMTITREWKPIADWWNKTGKVYLRGKIDLVALKGSEAIILDWKTGKRKNDPFQLQIYGSVLYHVLGLNRVDSGFVWLKTNESDTFTIDAGNIALIQQDITERISKVEEAYEQDKFPARPTPLCGWCPVLDECQEAIYYKVKRDRTRR